MKILGNAYLFVALLFLTLLPTARAATNVVTTANDTGAGSLRQTISNSISGDTITFNNTLSGATITLTNGELLLNKNLTIDASVLTQGITLKGYSSFSRILEVAGGVTNVLSALTITNGVIFNDTNGGGGGGILNNSGATLMISNCIISDNWIIGQGGIAVNGAVNGGGIRNNSGATMTIINCIISRNLAQGAGSPIGSGVSGYGGAGGGIYNAGTLTLSQNTLSANSAKGGGGAVGGGGGATGATGGIGTGGGIYNVGTLTLNQNTITSNSAAGGPGGQGGNGGSGGQGGNGGNSNGGGVYNAGTLTLNQNTICSNSAAGGQGGPGGQGISVFGPSGSFGLGSGGGIYSQATASITNSIVAVNKAGSGADIYISSGSLTFGGSNTVNTIFGSYSGAVSINAAPLLAPLGNYGGPTPTMPPLPGSPVIDAGSDGVTNTIATDQRGYPRLAGAHVDIGAVEGGYNAAGSGSIKTVTVQTNRSAKFTFTNFTGMTFTVLASTNMALPVAQWNNLGQSSESPVGSGQYQFTDPQAANNPRRFYRVRSP